MEPNKKWGEESLFYLQKLLNEGYSYASCAHFMCKKFTSFNYTRDSIRSAVRTGKVSSSNAGAISIKDVVEKTPEIEEETLDFFKEKNLPIEAEPVIDELIAYRKKKFRNKQASKNFKRLIDVVINVDGPIGIAHFGDPHIDDDGTDIALLLSHVDIVNKTEGMFAGNVGDQQNNWVGRLGHLWSQQSTSAKEAWMLTEHFVRSTNWLYLIAGNHDVWSGTGDPLNWIMRGKESVFDAWGARLNLKFPNGRKCRINARHDFKGRSIYNSAHGPARAIRFGWRDHIVTCGHTHQSGYQVLKDPASGVISHALRVGSYKTYDSYADKLGFDDETVFICPVTIIDPTYDEDDSRFITVIFDPFEASEYLTWKRKKYFENA